MDTRSSATNRHLKPKSSQLSWYRRTYGNGPVGTGGLPLLYTTTLISDPVGLAFQHAPNCGLFVLFLTQLSFQPHAQSARTFLEGPFPPFKNVANRLPDLRILQTAGSV